MVSTSNCPKLLPPWFRSLDLRFERCSMGSWGWRWKSSPLKWLPQIECKCSDAFSGSRNIQIMLCISLGFVPRSCRMRIIVNWDLRLYLRGKRSLHVGNWSFTDQSHYSRVSLLWECRAIAAIPSRRSSPYIRMRDTRLIFDLEPPQLPSRFSSPRLSWRSARVKPRRERHALLRPRRSRRYVLNPFQHHTACSTSYDA